MPEPTPNSNPNQGAAAPRPKAQEPPVKQKTMEPSPVSNLAQIDVTQPISLENQALIVNNTDPSTSTTAGNATLNYTPGLYQQHQTFKVPAGWGLNKIAKHLGVTVEALKNFNSDKVKYSKNGVAYFNENILLTVPPQKPGKTTQENPESDDASKEELETALTDATKESQQESVPTEEKANPVSVGEPGEIAEKGSVAVPSADVKEESKKDPEIKDVETVEEIKQKETPAATEDPNKIVLAKGELTRLGEGANLYIHWPEQANSGVTVGIGYDLGGRKEAVVKKDLEDAGFANSKASEISAGAQKKGGEAEKFVNENKDKIGPLEYDKIKKLFYIMAARYEHDAKWRATTGGDLEYTASGQEKLDGVKEGTYKMTTEQWEALHPAMKELITDLKYQGKTYSGNSIAKMNKVLIENHGNHLNQFKEVKKIFEEGFFDECLKGNNKTVKSDISETFFGEKMELKDQYRRNMIRLAYINSIIKALESGKEVVVEEGAKESETKIENKTQSSKPAYLGSWVGKVPDSKRNGASRNLPADVKKVQNKLLLLQLISEADYATECPTAESSAEVPVSKLPKTIEAIGYFQYNVLGWNTRFGYVDPVNKTIQNLLSMTLEQKEKSEESNKIKRQKSKEEAEEKAKAEATQKNLEDMKRLINEVEEKRKKINEEIKKQRISSESSSYLNVYKYYQVFKYNISGYAKFLKEFVHYNPRFVLRSYNCVNFIFTDDLTMAIMKLMTDSEINSLPASVDELFYDTMDWGKTTKAEEAKMALLKKGKKKKGKEKKEELIISENVKETAEKDLKVLRKTTKAHYIMKANVGDKNHEKFGEGVENYKEDVEFVAELLQEKGIEVSDSHLKGVFNDDLIEAIKKFETDIRKKSSPDGVILPTGGNIKNLDDASHEIYKSGIKDIHSGRDAVGNYLVEKDARTLKSAVGDKNEPNFGAQVVNDKKDVIYIADLLQRAGQTVTNKNLEDGECDATMISAIKAIETNAKHKKTYGVIMPGKSNFTALQKSAFSSQKIGKLSYTNGEHSADSGTDENAYYDKMDILESNLELTEGTDNKKILTIARKAARSEEYFAVMTENVSAKLLLNPENISDNGKSLSPVLAYRMERFHKFMVAAGLYNGDMGVSSGIRHPKTAHKWCVQWIIGSNAKKGTDKKGNSINSWSYVNQTKEILKEMYLEQKNDAGDFIVDKDGNEWAPKDQFAEKDGKVEILSWSKIQEKARKVPGGRNGYSSPANEGYKKYENKRRPAPPIKPTPSNHLSGEAIDIDRKKFFNFSDALIDVIALNYGLVRAGGNSEWWHFELTDLKMSGSEETAMKNKTYPNQEK